MIKLNLTILTIFISSFLFGQSNDDNTIKPVDTIKGIEYWYGVPVSDFLSNTDIIIEGRILSDSVYFQNPPGHFYTFHNVLILKKFKGDFISDTISIVTWGGKMLCNNQWEATQGAYTFKGDEAVIFARQMSQRGSNSKSYYVLYGDKAGFKTVCDKKDVIKEVYEPIEKATGTLRIVLRKNSCEK